MLYQLRSVSVNFKKRLPALNSVNLDIGISCTTLISGPTGAGKTTLLRLLYGDLQPASGTVFFKGDNLAEMSGKQLSLLLQISGIIYQEPKLHSNLNCFENVEIPLILNGIKKVKANNKCLGIMAKLGINYLRTKYPEELSVGEKKLVNVARALVHEPEVIFADEPTENLDDTAKVKVIDLFRHAASRGASLVIATNDTILRNVFSGANDVRLLDGRIDTGNKHY